MVDLGTLEGQSPHDSTGYALNNAGQVTGSSGQRAFLYTDGAMVNLGVLAGNDTSTGIGINEKGEVVGESYGGTAGWRAFLYSDGQLHDVNELLMPDSAGWILKTANDINDLGMIVGTGYFNGQVRAFLATPVPEPGTWLLMLLGCGAICALKRPAHDCPTASAAS